MKHDQTLRQPNKILVIRRDNIGDLVCTTPAIAALRKHYPDSEIAALVNTYNAEVLLGNPDLDHVFVYQKLKHAGNFASRFGALARRIDLIIKLRAWKPDVTILAKSSYDRHGLNLARQIGAKNIIGFVQDNVRQVWCLPDIPLTAPKYTGIHEVQAINELLKPLGIEDALGHLQVFSDANMVKQLNQKLPAGAKRIALHISAREPERRWCIENFIMLTNHILDSQPDAQILLFWSPGKADDRCHPGDDEAAARLIQVVQSDRLVSVPTQTLSELIAALSLCELFIGADGGAMHLAAALNKKILALFENLPSKITHWYPWRVNHRIVCSQYSKMPEISLILLQQIEQALKELGY